MKKPEFTFENQWKDFFERSVSHIVGIWFKLEICGFTIFALNLSRYEFYVGLLGFSLEIKWGESH